jgi:hypothetical protein
MWHYYENGGKRGVGSDRFVGADYGMFDRSPRACVVVIGLAIGFGNFILPLFRDLALEMTDAR